MRNLLILILGIMLGICFVYTKEFISTIILLGMIVGLLYATIKEKKRAWPLPVLGIAIGALISLNYQSIYVNNKYYVDSTYHKKVGLKDQYIYHNRLIEVENYKSNVGFESLSEFIVGTNVQMNGCFTKIYNSKSGIVFQAKDVEIQEYTSRSFRWKLETSKKSLADKMKNNWGTEQGSLAASLVLGVQDDVLKSRQNTLKFLGILHILSISGFHVNLLEMILERMGLKKSKLFIITCYAILINSVSGWRACLMRLAKVMGNGLKRDCDALNQLLLSAMVLLMYRPYLLFSISFQLTYLATLGLILLPKPIRELTIKLPKGKIKEGLILSCSAMVPCIPILSTMSFDVNLALFPANLVLVPLYSMFCMLSFFSFPLIILNLKVALKIVGLAMTWLLQLIYFFEYIIAEYFSLRIAWSGAMIFLWLFVFYSILKKYPVRPLKTVISLLVFYAFLFQISYLPGTTRIIFHKQMGQARVVIQQNLRQYEFVTVKMFKPSVEKWTQPVDKPLAVGNVLLEPGVVFPKVTLEDFEISPMEDPSSDIIDEEYLLIFGKLIRLK